MKKLIILVTVASSIVAVAQTCIVPAPSAPPQPTSAVVVLPVDGGTSGCTIRAIVPNGGAPTNYVISNAKCATVVAIVKQAAANDNGWNDGGVP